jgi:YD repeat-containing protein
LNRTARANLLRTVSRPLGGQITLDYARQGNFVSATSSRVPGQQGANGAADPVDVDVVMPHSQWALHAVSIGDGHSVGEGHDFQTTFDYFNSGFYDRAERENYGYAHVRTTRENGTFVDEYFYNQAYENHGRVGLVREFDAHGVLLRDSVHGFTRNTVFETDPPVTFTPETSTESRLFGNSDDGMRRSVRTRVTRDFEPLATGSAEWVLNRIHDEGDADPAATQDNVTYTIGYFAGPSTRCIRPNSIVASADGAPSVHNLPVRVSHYDATHCTLTLVSDLVSGGVIAHGTTELAAAPLSTTLEYDRAYGTLQRVVDPTGFWVQYEHDGRFHQYVTDTHDIFGYHSLATPNYELGVPADVTDTNNEKQTFVFDMFGRIRAVLAPGDGAHEDFDPDREHHEQATSATVSFGYSIPSTPTVTAPARAVTHHRALPGEAPLDTYTFLDGLHRVLETQRDAVVAGVRGATVSGAIVYDSVGRTRAQGQPQFRSDLAIGTFAEPALVNRTEFTYDDLNRVTQTQFPDLNTVRTQYSVQLVSDSSSGTSTWEQRRTYNERGVPSDTFVDAAGRMLRVVEYNHTGHANIRDVSITNLTAIPTNYFYDAMGRLTRVRVRDSAALDTTVRYDSLGRRTHIVSPDTGDTEYRYEATGVGAGLLGERITPNLRAQHASITYE